MMRFGSVCSGIEAASVAWGPLGWEAAWFSEIEPFPSAVLKHHYPDVPNLGDMTTLPERIRSGEVEAPDLFCGGTPCQAFSVAGLRKSLGDARGNLSLTFCEIANAIDAIRQQPCIIFWENVPGVLSTKDNAFGCFLAGLAGEDEALVAPGGRWTDAGFVDGPKRAIAWRVLDAQHFGLAQRRKRVFVVASARADFDPAAVLFEWEGVRRDSAPSREARKVAPTIPSHSTAGGDLGTDFDCDGGLQVAQCLTTGTGQRYDPETETETILPVAHSLRGEGFDASEDGTGRGTPLVPVAIDTDCYNGAITGGVAATIGTRGSSVNTTGLTVMQPVAHIDTMPTMMNGANTPADHNARSGHTKDTYIVPVVFHPTQDPISSTEVCHSIGANENATAAVAVQASQSGVRINDTIGTLDANYGSRRHNGVMQAMQVRRLTPVECERLQGFPDNYTAIPWRKKPASECPDGPRYKALGNSWAVPVVRWIGRRIDAAI